MKLYPTPPSILHLLTWVLQCWLAFGKTLHVGWPSGLRPSAITILQSAAWLAAGGFDQPCWTIKSFFLLRPAGCLIVRPEATAQSCPTTSVLANTISSVTLDLGHSPYVFWCTSSSWKKFQFQKENNKTLLDFIIIFLVFRWRYHDFRHILQKLPSTTLASIITNSLIKLWNV